MVNIMIIKKHTLETFASERNITKQSALNKISKLKKEGKVNVSGGGAQKRIYTVSNKPIVEGNGFYFIVNKYSPDKLNPKFTHVVNGNYSVERAIVDGLIINEFRELQAVKCLFNHVKNWTVLFRLAKKKNVEKELLDLYEVARKEVKVRAMPERYKR